MGGFTDGLPPSKIDQRDVPTRSKDVCGSDIKIKKADHRLSPSKEIRGDDTGEGRKTA